jgi:hypothetical protein
MVNLFLIDENNSPLLSGIIELIPFYNFIDPGLRKGYEKRGEMESRICFKAKPAQNNSNTSSTEIFCSFYGRLSCKI